MFLCSAKRAAEQASLRGKSLTSVAGNFSPWPPSLFAEAKWVPRIRWKHKEWEILPQKAKVKIQRKSKVDAAGCVNAAGKLGQK